MKIRKYILNLAAISILAVGFGGCDGLFRDEPIDKLSLETVWGSPLLLDEYTLPWYRNMSNGFSVFMPTSFLFRATARPYYPWLGDQLSVGRSDWFRTAYGDILKGLEKTITLRAGNYWSNCYMQIQNINRLLENQHKIANGAQKQRLLGEAHFFRGYYYYLLLRQFGGVLLIDRTYDPLIDNKKFPRASYEEMVEFIAKEADRAAELLAERHAPSELGRVTKGAALMLKGKTYFWASGVAFQKQKLNYLGFTTDRSNEMMTQTVNAYDEVMKLGYSLMPVDGTSQEEIVQSYHEIFLTKNSQESILEVQHSNDGNFDKGFGHKLDREAASPFFGGTTAAYTPTQNHVDEYGMRDGAVYDPKQPYLNRDYRFYANVLYDGATYNGHVMELHYTMENGKKEAGADLTKYGTDRNAGVTQTGYYMRKFLNPKQVIDNDPTYGSSQNYIIWRYAELLLDYAEIDFHQGRTKAALDKVNEIRTRAHMHKLDAITLENILNERRVEMAFEETTYWDFFRLGNAVEKLNGSSNPLKKMEIVKEEGKETTYTISNMNAKPESTRSFSSHQYYYPIPVAEVKYHEIPQNPEWGSNQ